ncbi:hypothetical protein EHW67_01210 [Arenibacter aquaticus]|uniref:HEAT repeat domain-containing protein n=1 Tax=Arenibacter aquaticus TaxID=2489054 RepID=A0A3S0IQC8_9FLAO|nr:hypothetical protein [Arenibacter aquaticus]RTE55213.1 hypothetical protein EHW67_01210 [Arenibacter aquaticus]
MADHTALEEILKYLKGGDLRSVGSVADLIPQIRCQADFDLLFSLLHWDNRLIVMRAVDAIEKITIGHPEYLYGHANELMQFLISAKNKEFKWHLATLISRLSLAGKELERVWGILKSWVMNPQDSKVVRVNALQALYDISRLHKYLKKELDDLIPLLQKEGIPSINSKISKLYK